MRSSSGTTSVFARRSQKPRRSSRVTKPSAPRPSGINAEHQADQPPAGAAKAEPPRAVLVLDPDREQAHPRGLPGRRPEGEQVDRAEDDPGADTEDDPRGADALRVPERREDEPEQRRGAEEDPVQDHAVEHRRAHARDQSDVVGRLRAGPADHPPDEALETVVEAAGDRADLAADVAQQPDALRGDRGPELGRLGDPLDQLLRLVRSQQSVPDVVDQLGVEHLDSRPLDGRARQGALERVLRRLALEHADDRPLDGGALERAHDRLLGGALDRVVDPGRRGHPLGAAGADAEQPAGKLRPSPGVLLDPAPSLR